MLLALFVCVCVCKFLYYMYIVQYMYRYFIDYSLILDSFATGTFILLLWFILILRSCFAASPLLKM